jgi:hypothetical protein
VATEYSSALGVCPQAVMLVTMRKSTAWNILETVRSHVRALSIVDPSGRQLSNTAANIRQV